MLLVRCFGLSLSDHYWIKPEGQDLSWEEINYFTNAFSDDIGDVLFGAKRKAHMLNFSSPDNTSDGNLKKRWKIIDGKRCLIKGGSNPFRQQPFNEVIASKIMERLSIPHIPYRLLWNKEVPYSVCEDFITEHTELVPAWRIIQTKKKNNSVSWYRHFVECAENLGIMGVTDFLDRMIVLDFIIANEDRHLNNFGAIRDPLSLKWLGMAPVYDSGSSLGYDKLASDIRFSRHIVCKPFKKNHQEQLKLVRDFSWIDFDSLTDIGELIKEVYTSPGAENYMDSIRIRAIVEAVEGRIRMLKKLASMQKRVMTDSIDLDVEKDIAETYDHF